MEIGLGYDTSEARDFTGRDLEEQTYNILEEAGDLPYVKLGKYLVIQNLNDSRDSDSVKEIGQFLQELCRKYHGTVVEYDENEDKFSLQ